MIGVDDCQADPGPAFYFFIFKTSISQKRVATFRFFIDFSGDDLHLFQAYRGVSPLFGSLGSEFPVSVTPPAWTVLAGSGQSGHVWGMNE